ncbi:MAG: hypothetical protein AAFR54_00525 [Planctomycetota bacterium]
MALPLLLLAAPLVQSGVPILQPVSQNSSVVASASSTGPAGAQSDLDDDASVALNPFTASVSASVLAAGATADQASMIAGDTIHAVGSVDAAASSAGVDSSGATSLSTFSLDFDVVVVTAYDVTGTLAAGLTGGANGSASISLNNAGGSVLTVFDQFGQTRTVAESGTLTPGSYTLTVRAVASGSADVLQVGDSGDAAFDVTVALSAAPPDPPYCTTDFDLFGFRFTGDVLRVNSQTGASVLVGNNGFEYMTAPAIDDDGQVFAVSDPFLGMPELVRIDPRTGAGTVVANLNLGTTIATGLEWDSANDRFYVLTVTELYTVDPTTGVATLVGPYGSFAPVLSSALSPTGELYAWCGENGSPLPRGILEIDTTTGAAAFVALGEPDSIYRWLAFDEDGTLYGGYEPLGGNGDIRTIDLATGQGTVVSQPGPLFMELGFFDESLGVRYCTAQPNSTGDIARISAAGCNGLADASMTLRATGLPPGAPALFFFGTLEGATPLGGGTLCVSGSLQRLPVGLADMGGNLESSNVFGLPLTTVPLGPGTFHFQVWYRDPFTAVGSNLSAGLAVQFLP